MPRVNLRHDLDQVPLTVAVVAEELGVATSTLRTWERRYGLGPSARTIGSHRRYTALDVARLRHMRKLIDEGASPCDAARQVLDECLEDLELDYGETPPLDPTSLRRLVETGNITQTRVLLERMIAQSGLLKCWTDLIKPAWRQLLNSNYFFKPGSDPISFLKEQVYAILRELIAQSPNPCDCPDAPRVMIIGSGNQELALNILGAALLWDGRCVALFNSRTSCWAEQLVETINKQAPQLVVFLEPGSAEQTIIEQLSQVGLPLVLVGDDLPDLFAPQIIRLHTLTAAVAEITEFLDELMLNK